MHLRRFSRACVATGVLVLSLQSAPAEAASTTFTVNTEGDQVDADVTDAPNRCDADTSTAGNQCTLRAAIQESNATRGRDKIHFDIPGGGVRTVLVLGLSLPPITKPVTIDGYTQPEAAENTIPLAVDGTNASPTVEIRGNFTSGGSGLLIDTSNVTVRGLVINGFSIAGILLIRGEGHKVQGNFLGTDATGNAGAPGNTYGVGAVSGLETSTIGGTAPSARNVIANNTRSGDGAGIFLRAGSRGNKIQGNLIGTKTGLDGTVGNSGDGVELTGAAKTTVGGSGAAANLIAFNLGSGVSAQGVGNRILGNSIVANRDLGIDLGDDGVTANDVGDTDAGANRLQNYPVWEFAHQTLAGDPIRIGGRLESRPHTKYTVQLFASTFKDGSGFGEGHRYLGQVNLETNGQGERRFIFEFDPARPVFVDEFVSATATDRSRGDTSEFSQVFHFTT